MRLPCSASLTPLRFQGVTDEVTAQGRAILEREKASFKNGGRLGETHTAFTTRRREPVKKVGLELNRFFGRGKQAATSGDAAAAEEQRALLLTEERADDPPAGPPRSRADELKARLASKVEAVKSADARPKTSWTTVFGGSGEGSSAAPSAPAAAPPAAPAPAAPRGGSTSDSLDALFANLGKR